MTGEGNSFRQTKQKRFPLFALCVDELSDNERRKLAPERVISVSTGPPLVV
jgi:hypothetical protein